MSLLLQDRFPWSQRKTYISGASGFHWFQCYDPALLCRSADATSRCHCDYVQVSCRNLIDCGLMAIILTLWIDPILYSLNGSFNLHLILILFSVMSLYYLPTFSTFFLFYRIPLPYEVNLYTQCSTFLTTFPASSLCYSTVITHLLHFHKFYGYLYQPFVQWNPFFHCPFTLQ